MDTTRRSLLKFFGASTLCGMNYLFSTPIQAKANSASWSHGLPLNTPIQEIYPTVFNDEIYVAGGFVPSSEPVFFGLAPSSQVYIYNPTKQTWRNGIQLPEVRHHLGLAANANYLYGIGGFYGDKRSAWQIRNTVYKMSAKGEMWDNGPSLPIPLAESVYACVDENIHVIGGKTRNTHSQRNIDTNSHFVLIDDKHWEKAAPAPITRNSAASAVLDDKVYVIAGRQAGKDAKNLAVSEVYDPKLDKWQSIRPLPRALAGLSAVALNGKIVVAGGEAFGANGNWKTGKAFAQVWSYDPAQDTWQEVMNMPKPRHGHGAVSFNDSMYIIGGGSKVGPQDTLSSLLIVDA